jgi:hypothetical protein
VLEAARQLDERTDEDGLDDAYSEIVVGQVKANVDVSHRQVGLDFETKTAWMMYAFSVIVSDRQGPLHLQTSILCELIDLSLQKRLRTCRYGAHFQPTTRRSFDV